MTFGFDTLLAMKYPGVFRDTLGYVEAFGVIYYIPDCGKSDKVLEIAGKSGKAKIGRIHLTWKDHKPGLVFAKSDLPLIEKLAAETQRIIRKYPGIGWHCSPVCEPVWSSKSIAEEARRIIKREVPAAQYVNSVYSQNIVFKGEINEVHNSHPKPSGNYIFSNDGEACVDTNIEARKRSHKDSRVFFLWDSRFNGRWEPDDTTPRPQRKGWPDIKLMQSIARLSRNNDVAVKLPKGWLWKSHSENHGSGDKRAEKPVLILPQKLKSVELVDENGHEVTTLTYYGPFDGGGHRYYSNLWGYEIEAKAKRQSGLSTVCVSMGATNNEFNPSFRAGVFRK